jgi:rare lipoprotein A
MRRRTAYGFAIVLSIACLGAAHNPIQSEASKTAVRVPPTAAVPKTPRQAKPYQIGTASWYGTYFQGRATASGEPYDMYDMTAAHPSLPLGTWVRVTNLRNGRAVVVRVNDRGPVVEGRIIDLSYNAAGALDMRSQGIQNVRLDIVPPMATVAMLRE